MTSPSSPACIAFDGDRLLAKGSLSDVAKAVRRRTTQPDPHDIRIFDYATSRTLEFDLRGSEADMLARLETPETTTRSPEKRGPGRPKLGVTAKEVTLLPRHWGWLATQPGGASVTLRKLVEAARRASEADPKTARDIAYRFMSRMAGDRENFEEATRALYASDGPTFEQLIETWPWDIYEHLRHLAADAFFSAKDHPA